MFNFLKKKNKYTPLNSPPQHQIPDSDINTFVAICPGEIVVIQNLSERLFEVAFYSSDQTLREKITVEKSMIIGYKVCQYPTRRGKKKFYDGTIEFDDGRDILIVNLSYDDGERLYNFLKNHTLTNAPPKEIGFVETVKTL